MLVLCYISNTQRREVTKMKRYFEVTNFIGSEELVSKVYMFFVHLFYVVQATSHINFVAIRKDVYAKATRNTRSISEMVPELDKICREIDLRAPNCADVDRQIAEHLEQNKRNHFE
jgi:hypothetical protein